jgi:stage V sporulation protein G
MDYKDLVDAETVSVSFVVMNARPIESKALFALVDVEMQIAGVTFSIFGVQARRESDGQTSVRLPTFKDADGIWRSAIQMPGEIRAPLADAVLTFLMEEGLAKRRFEPPSCKPQATA